jgi:hypothetical protein
MLYDSKTIILGIFNYLQNAQTNVSDTTYTHEQYEYLL